MAVKATRSGHGSACQSCKLRLAGVPGSRQTCGQIDNAAARVPRTPPVPAQCSDGSHDRNSTVPQACNFMSGCASHISYEHKELLEFRMLAHGIRVKERTCDCHAEEKNDNVAPLCLTPRWAGAPEGLKPRLDQSVSTMNTFIINKRYSPRPARDPCRSPGFCSDLPDLGEGLRDGARLSLSRRAVTACGVDVALFQKARSVIRLRGRG
ncbi:hypothetical protein MJG53_016007 [Ovis ammon polii x Ovis aries]|uniref:Uncharacterized protein n=1 Tax=Ovis ammon polii x Ovis aries TaxID=2918886 RepID=A0ACB9UCP2_9CETA|nr:hypothetical protein MJG53_016007 [Ovis ammon polii x Ovis aries]